MATSVANAGSMCLLAMVSVGLWTLRVALAARGRRALGAAVAAGEALVFALVFSTLVAELGSWDRLAGYAVGVAVGTVGGIAVNDRVTAGGSVVEVVVPGDGHALRTAFCERGWPYTAMPASGMRGAATVLFLVIRSRHTAEVLDVVRRVQPEAFWATRPAMDVRPLGESTAAV